MLNEIWKGFPCTHIHFCQETLPCKSQILCIIIFKFKNTTNQQTWCLHLCICEHITQSKLRDRYISSPSINSHIWKLNITDTRWIIMTRKHLHTSGGTGSTTLFVTMARTPYWLNADWLLHVVQCIYMGNVF